MGIYRKIEVDIIKEGKCINYISENTKCNNSYFIILILNGINYYYCIECEMEELQTKLKDSLGK